MRRLALVLATLVALSGCGLDLFSPYCDDLGVYPACHYSGGAWLCPTSNQRVCNDGGFEAHYDCGDLGGVYCRIR